MEENLKKYAEVILKVCLKVEKNTPLVISCNSERLDFVRIITKVAYELGVNDIYYDITDSNLKHEALKNLSLEDLKKSQMFNKDKWNEYAINGASFLMLASETPDLLNDVDPKLLSDITTYSQKTRTIFDDLRDEAKVAWCIAVVPTLSWAKKVFPNDLDPVNTFWNKIFEICHINDNPENYWNIKIEQLSSRANKLNNFRFKKLIYKSSNGTNFSIELPQNHIWATGKSLLKNNKEVLVNFPTEEIFTSPNRLSANGILHNSKPLSYQDNIIDDFYITFKNGKVVDVKAKMGENILKELISSTPNMDYLGEVALVDNSSSISSTNIIFYETLFDENAACHFALGAAFPECILNGNNMNKEDLLKNGLNDSLNHVDFMIGNSTLDVIGVKYDNEEVQILKNGNFVI